MGTHRYRRIEIGESVIPEEAISLIEDIQTLGCILDMLVNVRERSITVPRQDQYSKAKLEAQQMLRRVGFLVSGMHSIAKDNLRHEFLAGKRLKHPGRRQTLADVWQLLHEGKGGE